MNDRDRCNSLLIVQIAGLMTGIAILLFLPACFLAECLNKSFRIDDDWSLLVLPAGMLIGLFLGLGNQRKSVSLIAWLMLALMALLWLKLLFPVRIPDSVPVGMNRLPYALGNLLRIALWTTLSITFVTSFAVAAVVSVCRQLFRQLTARIRLRSCQDSHSMSPMTSNHACLTPNEDT